MLLRQLFHYFDNIIYCFSIFTVEDYGWVEGDDDSKGEISIQEELEDA